MKALLLGALGLCLTEETWIHKRHLGCRVNRPIRRGNFLNDDQQSIRPNLIGQNPQNSGVFGNNFGNNFYSQPTSPHSIGLIPQNPGVFGDPFEGNIYSQPIAPNPVGQIPQNPGAFGNPFGGNINPQPITPNPVGQIPQNPGTFGNTFGGNFVENGNFENFDLKGKKWRLTGDFPGWWVRKGQVGLGHLYNKNWNPETKVIELDASHNVNFMAKVTLPQRGEYLLTFDYAARQHKPLHTSSFTVKINGETYNITPNNYNVNQFKAKFIGNKGVNNLNLIGKGHSDSFGVTIDNVSITRAHTPQICY